MSEVMPKDLETVMYSHLYLRLKQLDKYAKNENFIHVIDCNCIIMR